MEENRSNEETKKNDSETKTKKRFPLWQKIVAGIATAIVVLILIVNWATSGVAKIGNQYLEYIKSKNVNAAYSLMTKEAMAATDKDEFSDTVDRIGPVLNGETKMTSKEVAGETGQAGTGKVVYEIKGTDGVTYEITINLQKEEGNWKVLNFESNKKK